MSAQESESLEQRLVGNWKIDFQKTSSSVDADMKEMLNSFSSTDMERVAKKHSSWRFEFNTDKSFTSSNDQGESYQGKWSISGAELQLSYSNGEKAKLKILQLSQNALSWQLQNRAGFVYKKWYFNKIQ